MIPESQYIAGNAMLAAHRGDKERGGTRSDCLQ